MHKEVKCLDVATGRVYISRDVVFHESVFPFEKYHSNADARLHKEILLLLEILQTPSVLDLGEQHDDDLTPNVSASPFPLIVPHAH
jgi:hypothetical protein